MKTWNVQYLCEWQNFFRLFFPFCLVLHRLRFEGWKDPVALLLNLFGIHLHEVHFEPLLALFSGSGTGLLPFYQRWKYRKVERISCTGFYALDFTGKYTSHWPQACCFVFCSHLVSLLLFHILACTVSSIAVMANFRVKKWGEFNWRVYSILGEF